MKSIKTKVISGLAWKLFENSGRQGIQLIIQIVLARMLLPEDFGIIAIITVFITIADVFIQYGFTSALIQKQRTDDEDYSTVFYASFAVSIVLYIALFSAAPFIAGFYSEEILQPLIRVQSVTLIFSSLSSIQNAKLLKEMQFKKSFFRSLIGVVAQGLIGIYLAYEGLGVWALVFSNITYSLIGTIVLCFTVRWHPKALFSFKSLKELFSFSSKVLSVTLLNTIFNNVYSLVIGKTFDKDMIGFYNRGQSIPSMIAINTDGAMNAVLFSALSICQNNLPQVKNILRRSLKTSLFVMLPVMLGLASVAEPLVSILLTDKWLPCVPFLQYTCISCISWPFTAGLHALNALGLSKNTLKIGIYGKICAAFFLIITIPLGIHALMIGSVLSAYISVVIIAPYLKKHLQYSYKEQCSDALPPILLAAIMTLVITLVKLVVLDVWAKLFMQIGVGVITYVGLSYILKIESLTYICTTIRQIINRKKSRCFLTF